MTRLLAIDPGTTESAWLVLRGGVPQAFGKLPNDELLAMLRRAVAHLTLDRAVIEQVASYGMPVGREVFETVRWAGRFEEALHPVPVALVPRLEVRLALCHSTKATDATVRRALLDRFGGESAVGRKAAPGPLYGIHHDVWSALAVACVYADQLKGAA